MTHEQNMPQSEEKQSGPQAPDEDLDEVTSKMKKAVLQDISTDPSTQTFAQRPEPLHEQMVPTFIVEANFFRVRFPESKNVFQYNIEFFGARNIQIKKKEFISKAFWYAFKKERNIFPDHHAIAFNGTNILWSTEKLKISAEKTISFSVVEQEERRRRGPPKEFKMRIKYSGLMELNANPETTADQMVLTSVMDAVLTTRLTCLYEADSDHFYKAGKAMFCIPDNAVGSPYVADLGEILEAWTGLHGAIKVSLQEGLLLNVDVGHSAFYKKGYNLVDLLTALDNAETGGRGEDLPENFAMSAGQRNKLKHLLTGLQLEYRRSNSKKTFKFIDMTPRGANQQTFHHNETNRDITVYNYFLNMYGYRLRYPNLPCFITNKMRRTYAPMELIFTDSVVKKFKGKISERELRQLVKSVSFPPAQRKALIEEMAAVNQENQNNALYLAQQDLYMRNYNIEVDRTFLQVKASLIPGPILEFGEGALFHDQQNEGMWDLKNGKSLKKVKKLPFEPPAIIPALIFFTPNANINRYECNPAPLGTLMEVIHHMGMACPGGRDAYDVKKFDWCNGDWSTVGQWMKQFKTVIARDVVNGKLPNMSIPLPIFIFPFKTIGEKNRNLENSTEYGIVKYICDVIVGIHCQCLVQQTFYAMAGGIGNDTSQHLALKIIGKVGQTLYTIDRENPSWRMLTNPDEPTLLLGIDVTHAGEQERREGKYSALSVAAVVGNVDLACMNYAASCRLQAVGQERTFLFGPEIRKRILDFHRSTGKWPAHIVVYRDAVSESEFQKTLYEEKDAIKKACSEIEEDGFKTPTITYIMCQKRHHTRFFAQNAKDTAGQYGNLKPGTLIESSVTTKCLFDFYLYGHHGRIGTSRPTHFFVLWDEWAPSSTFWQKITFYLCYGLLRCTGSISQPVPSYYGHLAAKRAKDYLKAHVTLNEERFRQLTEYERIADLQRHLEKHRDLKGMIFQ